MTALHKKIEPPYYMAIIDTGFNNSNDNTRVFKETSRMIPLATKQAGFLGLESRYKHGRAVVISYWRSVVDIDNWKNKSGENKKQGAKKNQRPLAQVRLVKRGRWASCAQRRALTTNSATASASASVKSTGSMVP